MIRALWKAGLLVKKPGQPIRLWHLWFTGGETYDEWIISFAWNVSRSRIDEQAATIRRVTAERDEARAGRERLTEQFVALSNEMCVVREENEELRDMVRAQAQKAANHA